MRVGPRAAAVALLIAACAIAHPAVARDRVLRCATSPSLGQALAPEAAPPGHVARADGGRRFYAPVRSAMFFSRAGSGCRWKLPHRHHG
ncbi:hypothetical protein [Lichenicoccus sp.]|uniref:hypothetical protein n=1 Tax=Lichenicoccus sp. TaxID=2781899 RepID=UPI003D1227B5